MCPSMTRKICSTSWPRWIFPCCWWWATSWAVSITRLLTLDALAARGLRGTGMILCRTRPDRPEETCLLADNAAVLARKGAERGFPLLADLPFLSGLDAPSCGERESAWARLSALLRAAARHALSSCAEKISEQNPAADALLAFDRDHVWHPYAPAAPGPKVWEAVSTSGVRIRLRDGREVVDGMSSWWCAALAIAARN